MRFFTDKISNMDTLMFCSIALLLCVIIQVLNKINQFQPEYIDLDVIHHVVQHTSLF